LEDSLVLELENMRNHIMKGKLLLILTPLLILFASQTLRAQSEIGIVLNEYSASNVGTPTDNYGEQSDWVELYNNFSTQVSFNGYYLSNDRSNLLKWKFPGNYTLPVGGYGVVWLTGRGISTGNNLHANFNLEQCKNQWLILTYSSGGVQTVRDSVFVQKTKAGHSRGRVDYTDKGIGRWRLYASHSFLEPNPPANNYLDYAPIPEILLTPKVSPLSSNINGGFTVDQASVAYFRLKGEPVAYSYTASCYDIYYTMDGSRPNPPFNGTLYNVDDSTTSPIIIDVTKVIRAISVLRDTCHIGSFLPSFIETNTYFALTGEEKTSMSEDFGVLSLAIDPVVQDTSWFSSGGHPQTVSIHAEYYDKQLQVSEGYAFLNRPPQETWRTTQKGFYVSIDDKQGFGCNFEGPIFNVEGLGVSSRTVFPTLHVYAGDFESESNVVGTDNATWPVQGTGLRDVFVQSLAAKYNINVNPLHVKPIRLYQNGKYMGVYTLKEVYDKYYENYYNQQPLDQLDLRFYYGQDANVTYPDGSSSLYLPLSSFRTSVYNVVSTKPLTQSTPNSFYASIIRQLDKSNFIDYMATNSYMMNGDLWNYNIAMAKGNILGKPGDKWHHYLWNMPAILGYTAVSTTTLTYPNAYYSPCILFQNTGPTDAIPSIYDVSSLGINAGGKIMNYLMNSTTGNKDFQKDYKSRFQDLLNTAFKCENVLKHFDYIYNLYHDEMKYHDMFSPFLVQADLWDTNMVHLRQLLEKRCYFVANTGIQGCLGLVGPFDITVDVEPIGSGLVKINSLVLDNYIWSGSYYGGDMSLKAIPTSTTYVFDHWEFQNHKLSSPLSLDSVSFNFNQPDKIVAVFTDKTKDLTSSGESANIPTGFTPNGDGINDVFKPLGSALYTSEYEMTIWNRWGQEVFRATDPSVGWDGNFHGQQAITGVYAYLIRYKNVYGESKVAKGNVTLTR